jgi:hypothetical protein
MVVLTSGDLAADLDGRLAGGGTGLGVVGLYINQIDELSELLIATAGLLYLVLVARSVRRVSPAV